MAIKQKLNTAWQTNESMDAVFEIRALAENAYNVIQESIARINEVVASSSFDDVDPEIVAKGAAIISILNQSKTALDGHSDFINWRKPD